METDEDNFDLCLRCYNALHNVYYCTQCNVNYDKFVELTEVEDE